MKQHFMAKLLGSTSGTAEKERKEDDLLVVWSLKGPISGCEWYRGCLRTASMDGHLFIGLLAEGN